MGALSFDRDTIRREDLAEILRGMRVGERVSLHPGSLTDLWPTPKYSRTDDWLDHKERADKWCAQFGCVIWETYDPAGFTIEKKSRG